MSPEQASGDLVDARSDIYSLGVVAFYALSGRLPFQAGTDEGFLAQHISDTAPKITTVVPLVPPRLAQIVDRCLSKEPWARYADAAALVRAIAEAVAPPAVPLAIRAFMVRSTHLEAPALISAFVTGVGLLPATAAAWLSPATASVRAATTVALGVALLLPVVVATVRVRRLLADGHQRGELVAALTGGQARRREELAFVYGPGPTSFERSFGWLARLALLTTIAVVGGVLGVIDVPPLLAPLLPSIFTTGAAIALLAAVVARARTEQRTDPLGERSLRFWRGPRAAAKLADPNGIPIHAVEEIRGCVFCAMAYIEGETLTERVRQRGPLPPSEASRMLRDVAWALAYAHGQGVIHRDVKPDNILLENGGRVLVADFGIASVVAGAGALATGEVVGTPEFMSPEQALGEAVDARSDLYSLGIVAYFACSGTLPFEGEKATDLLAKQVTQPAPALASVAPLVPRRLAQAIERW